MDARDRDGTAEEYREHAPAFARAEKVAAIVLPFLAAGERSEPGGPGAERGSSAPVQESGGRDSPAQATPHRTPHAGPVPERPGAAPASSPGVVAAAEPAEGTPPDPAAYEPSGLRETPGDRLSGEGTLPRVAEPGAGVPEAGALPFDLAAVERRVDQFFSRLGRLGENDPPTRAVLGLTTWAVVAAAVALEVVRSRVQRGPTEGGVGLRGGDR